MQNEHPIPGEDASLEHSIASLQAKLAGLGFDLEEGSWQNPVDNVWSVQIRNRACPLMCADGHGGTQLAACASALGEFFERLSCNDFWSDYFLGEEFANADFAHDPRERWFPVTGNDWPAELLTPELQAFYNPEGSIPAETLIDLNSGHYERGICALPYVRQRDGGEVFFPVNVIANLYAGNGMAAGDTADEARARALAEILECHVKLKVIADGLCLPDVPEEVVARTPAVAAGIAGLRAAGFGVLVKDASLGGRYPVLCVTLLNPRDQGVLTSFGTHPHFATALEKALTGLLRGRALSALDGLPPPAFDLEEVAGAANMAAHFLDASGSVHWSFFDESADCEFVDWNFTAAGRPADDHAWLAGRIHADGHDIYVAEFERLGVYACRILVPGMSEISPLDALERANNSNGAVVRPAILNLDRLDDEQCGQLLDILNELAIADDQPVAALIGLAADAGSPWAELPVGELKTLLALAVGDTDAILEGCEWIGQVEQFDADRRRVYRCIATLLEMDDPNRYEEALAALFGDEALDLATDLIDGEVRFFGIASPGLELAGCDRHRALLGEYAKVRAAQAAIAA